MANDVSTTTIRKNGYVLTPGCYVGAQAQEGFSPRNLKYMRRFAQAFPDEPIVQEVLAQITWHHNITILDKAKDIVARKFYVKAAIQHGRSQE